MAAVVCMTPGANARFFGVGLLSLSKPRFDRVAARTASRRMTRKVNGRDGQLTSMNQRSSLSRNIKLLQVALRGME
jgi:hypothetical protein